MMPSLRKLAAAACLASATALSLAACQSGPPMTLEQRLQQYQWRSLPLEQALFLFPAESANAPIAALQRPWDNGMEQRLALPNRSLISGEDYLALRFFYAPQDVGELLALHRQRLPRTRYVESSLMQQLREAFPEARVQLVGNQRSNRYGPYRYATASWGDERCVFAWQALESSSPALPSYLRALELEYRSCGRGQQPQQLLQAFDYGVLRMDTGVLPLDARPPWQAAPAMPPYDLPPGFPPGGLPPGPPAAAPAVPQAFPAPAAAPAAQPARPAPATLPQAAPPTRLFAPPPAQATPATPATPGSTAFPLPSGAPPRP